MDQRTHWINGRSAISVSTKVGIIAEGPIDYVLLPALLERIARDRVGYKWPVSPDDLAQVFHIRKRGHGRVLETVRRLVEALSHEEYDHAFFVILLDRRTRPVQEEIRQLIAGHGRFVMGAGPAHTQNEHRLVKMPFSRAATGDF